MNRRGMTLVEVLIATALSAIILAAGFSALTAGMVMYAGDYGRAAAQSDIEYAMDDMLGAMRRAPAEVSAEDGVLTVNGVRYYNAGGHVMRGGDALAQFAALTVAREGDTVILTVESASGVRMTRAWSPRRAWGAP